jgi:Peptidase family M1 domain
MRNRIQNVYLKSNNLLFMKKTPNAFWVFLAVVLAAPCQAQKMVINKRSDLPVIYFSLPAGQTQTPGAIDTTMQQIAAVEAKHLDSIEANYGFGNPRLAISTGFEKECCLFIAHRWRELEFPDSNLANSTLLPPFYRRLYTVEYKSYAKASMLSSPDLIAAFRDVISQSLDTLNAADKERVLKGIVSLSGTSKYYFKADWDTIWKSGPVADTNLRNMFVNYSSLLLKQEVGSVFTDAYEKLVRQKLTRADTLRGSLGPERTWWDVRRYDLMIKPDFAAKSISGKNVIKYAVTAAVHPAIMQLDLQKPMQIDSIFVDNDKKLVFTKDGNAWHVQMPDEKKGEIHSMSIYFSGKGHEAVNPPWEGGLSWSKDSLGRPMMTITCQGIGASLWYPCKDHQSDEPDEGASLSMIIPDTLMGISNGRMLSKTENHDGTCTYKWGVVNPINNYELIPYIGKYAGFSDTYRGKKGNLDLHYWALDYHLARAKAYMPGEVKKMLEAHESWFGPYPFYEDGYQLIESPVGGSMEHQSGVAYSGNFKYGFIGNQDLSGTGWGTKWDYMIVHESGHEWFGNSITSNDLADMWVHEGFTCYSETLYTEYWFGKAAGNAYNYGCQKDIYNNFPIIGLYGVNDEINQRNADIYRKSSAMLQTIRHSMDDDERFKAILQGLNKVFYHQTVNTAQIENYVCRQSGYDYSPVFNQYLRTTDIPTLEFYFNKGRDSVFYRYTQCIDGFDLPLVLKDDHARLRIVPGRGWKTSEVSDAEVALFDPAAIKKMYYVDVNAQ